jgi:hypothetical protein
LARAELAWAYILAVRVAACIAAVTAILMVLFVAERIRELMDAAAMLRRLADGSQSREAARLPWDARGGRRERQRTPIDILMLER